MAETTLSTQISNLATRIGTECKTIHTNIGKLADLTTTDKTSIVNALNELKTSISTASTTLNTLSGKITTLESSVSTNTGDITTIKGNITTLQTNLTALETRVQDIEDDMDSLSVIDDTTASTTTTYSSTKINSEITAAKNAVKSELLGGAGEAYDTLKELADLIQANGSSIETLQTLAAGHVKFDAAQSLTTEQQTQARTNIGAADATTVNNLSSTVSTNTTNISTLTTNLNNLTTNVGDTSTDFVAIFEAALSGS